MRLPVTAFMLAEMIERFEIEFGNVAPGADFGTFFFLFPDRHIRVSHVGDLRLLIFQLGFDLFQFGFIGRDRFAKHFTASD